MHLAATTYMHMHTHATSSVALFCPHQARAYLDNPTLPQGTGSPCGDVFPGRDAQAPVYPQNPEDLQQPHPEEGVEGR